MRKLRILLAEYNQQQLENLRHSVATDPAFEIIGACTDGMQAFCLAQAAHPDMIVCDVLLPTLDGLNLLERLSHMKQRPAFIFTSSLSNDVIARQAGLLGAEYFLLKPYDPQRLREVIHLAAEARAVLRQPTEDERKHKVYRCLVGHGYVSHVQGFQYLATGIQLALNDPSLLNNLTKGLYQQIAARHHTQAIRVERDIRHAITTTCSRTGQPCLSNRQILQRLVAELMDDPDQLSQC